MKRFGVTGTQGQLRIKRLPADGELRPLRIILGAYCPL